MKSLNENKAKELATRWKAKGLPYNAIYDTAIEVMQWKDEQFSIERKQLIEKANQAVTQSFENGAIFKKQEMIDKACKFLKSYRQDTPDGLGYIAGIVDDKTIEDFKKYMEGE